METSASEGLSFFEALATTSGLPMGPNSCLWLPGCGLGLAWNGMARKKITHPDPRMRCSVCEQELSKGNFSASQLKKSAKERKCQSCCGDSTSTAVSNPEEPKSPAQEPKQPTALAVAAYRGQANLVKALLDKEQNINQTFMVSTANNTVCRPGIETRLCSSV